MRGARNAKEEFARRVSDKETFARLIFYGASLLEGARPRFGSCPPHLLDQREVYKQFRGLAKARQNRKKCLPLSAAAASPFRTRGIW